MFNNEVFTKRRPYKVSYFMVSSKLFKRPVAENESSLPEEECDTPIVIQARRSTNSFGLNGSLTIPFQKMLQNIFNTQQTCSISARKSMMEFQQITFLLQKYCGEFRSETGVKSVMYLYYCNLHILRHL
jgi:hypothetical protein